MTRRITIEMLRAAGACEGAQEAFKACYPNGIDDWTEEMRRAGGWPGGMRRTWWMWITSNYRLPAHGLDTANADLRGLDLSGLMFAAPSRYSGWRLDRADLRGADLDCCDLRGVRFDDADLRGAWARGAQVTDTPAHREAFAHSRHPEYIIWCAP